MSRCPSCQQENPEANKFCGECGAPLTGAIDRPHVPSPESYTPKHLAEKILTSRGALEGERKQVTVLFADLKGSMELLADRDPEDARKLLDAVLARMMEAVHRYEGTVKQVMGDGIMALFGAPIAHEDHAVRACYAALRIQESVGRYGDELRRGGGLNVQIRVGLNSGEVVVRSIENDLHMDYTAVGRTTHLAARMEQIARPGSILLTRATLELAKGFVEVTPLGPQLVKGLAEPVEVYDLRGARDVRSRLDVAAARGLTRFVGRTTELAELREALRLARSGHGQLVAVAGEPGIGKSRLFREFAHSRHTGGCLIVETSAVSYGKATPYLPLVALLKVHFGIERDDDPRRAREKVAGRLCFLDPALEPWLPAVLWLLDLPAENAEWERLEPQQRRQHAIDATERLLVRESQVRPLVLMFEDLHWIDTETQAVLDSLVESLPATHILCLVSYRPEYRHGWSDKSHYRTLRIDPLPIESVDTMLTMLLGADPSLAPLKRLLIERTEGNPFFLEECVHTLVETKMLEGEPGGYRLSGPVDSLDIPASAQAVLAARIDRLAPEDKRLLQTASVIGKDVTFALLRAIADDTDEETLLGCLTRLGQAAFLHDARLFPELEYAFKHALTHEVAYRSLLLERRRELHGRIVASIERLYPDRLAEHVDDLARHASSGEVWPKAMSYSHQAGVRAAARSAQREAVASFDQALAAFAHLAASRELTQEAIDVRFRLRYSLLALGELLRVLDCLRAAAELAHSIKDEVRIGWAAVLLNHCLALLGRHEEAIEAGRRARGVAEATGVFALGAPATFYLGYAHFYHGDFDAAEELLRLNVTTLVGDLAHERFGILSAPLAVTSRAFLSLTLAERGEFDEALAQAEETLARSEHPENPWGLFHACVALGRVHELRGEFDRAVSVLRRGLAVCETREVRLGVSITAAALGNALAHAGHLDEALAILEPVTRALAVPYLLVYAGEAHLLAGRLDEAARLTAQGLELCAGRHERAFEAWARRLSGQIAAGRNPPDHDAAEAQFREALGLAEPRGMRPLVAHCHLGLGELYTRTNAGDRARAELAAAADLYRAMAMTSWLRRAETALSAKSNE